MPRISALAVAVLAIPVTVANANASYCDQIVEIATARLAQEDDNKENTDKYYKT